MVPSTAGFIHIRELQARNKLTGDNLGNI